MTRNHRRRNHQPSLEPLESRTVLSNVTTGSNLWPANRIPYVIDPSIKDTLPIIEAISEYNEQTNTQWIPRTNEADYINFTQVNNIGPHTGEAGASLVGDAQIGKQDIFLESNLSVTSTVLHEMGHTLGLWHEQDRNDHAAYVVQRSENLPPGVNLIIPSGSAGSEVGPFDYASVMLYGGYSKSINGQPTLTKPDGTPLPYNALLSEGDIAAINSLYPVLAGQAHVPRQVVATAESGQIQVAWTDTNSGQATYTVSRAAMGQALVPIATLGAGSTSYVDATAEHGVIYEYMVTANVSTGNPAVSRIVYAAVPATTPWQLAASVGPIGEINLAWNDVYGGAAYYVVDFMITGGSWVSLTAFKPGMTSFIEAGNHLPALSLIQYSYRIHAQVGSGTSLWVSDTSPTATLGVPPGSGTPPDSRTPPGSGTPPDSFPTTPPTIVGKLPLFQTVVIGHRKRRAITRSQFVGFQLVFSEPLDLGRAQNPGNYSVIQTIRRGRKALNQPVGISRAVYDTTNNSVSLYLAGKPKFQNGGRLTINASAPSGISDTLSDYLVGNAAFTILPLARGITG